MPRRKPTRTPHARAAPTRAPPPGTALIERGAEKGAVALTAEGLALVEATARAGGSQALVASRLGVALSTLKKVFDRDEPVRLAFERGKAEDEMTLVAGLRVAAAKGYAPAAMFLLKTVHGHRENDPVAPTQQSALIILPAAFATVEEWQAHRAQRSLAAPIDVASTVITKEIPNAD